MVSHPFFYQLALLALVWLCVMLLYAWPSDRVRGPTPAAPIAPRRKRSTEPTPCAGLTTKPYCALCEQASASLNDSLPLRPAPRPRRTGARVQLILRHTSAPIRVATTEGGRA
jgi:hypothetical protein